MAGMVHLSRGRESLLQKSFLYRPGIADEKVFKEDVRNAGKMGVGDCSQDDVKGLQRSSWTGLRIWRLLAQRMQILDTEQRAPYGPEAAPCADEPTLIA